MNQCYSVRLKHIPSLFSGRTHNIPLLRAPFTFKFCWTMLVLHLSSMGMYGFIWFLDLSVYLSQDGFRAGLPNSPSSSARPLAVWAWGIVRTSCRMRYRSLLCRNSERNSSRGRTASAWSCVVVGEEIDLLGKWMENAWRCWRSMENA